MMMHYYGPGMNGVALTLMIIGNVVFWGLLIVAAIALIRYTKRGQVDSSSPTASTPQQILAQRFARGDIDEDEYTRRLQVISGSSTSPLSG
jgi:putative membrane protein